MSDFVSNPDVLAASTVLLDEESTLVDLCVAVQQIAAPTGDEEVRAAWVARKLENLGLADVSVDKLHNVYARLQGDAPDLPALLVSAHTDTVFPAETDLTVSVDEENGRIYGPGIGDNSTGVASLIAVAEKLVQLPPPPSDIWFVANTGEEGLGDLRGMRSAVDRLEDRIGASIVIEGMGLGRVVHRALGSRRYRISASAPGGHSWSDFGTASAIHALVLLASELVRIKVPSDPRTTFNIGRISGGTSINTIAQKASLELDLRSEDGKALEKLIDQVHRVVKGFQTSRWQNWDVRIDMETIGDRPSGAIEPDHPLVVASGHALTAAGLTGRADLRISSTDSNIPLSRGIPSVCVGITQGGNAHRLEEWIDPQWLGRGMQHLLLLTWWASEWVAES
jgi:tripeptide aminopeptidase